MVNDYLKQISVYEKITSEEAVRLLETKGSSAHEELLCRTFWLIVSLARRWQMNAEKNRIEIMDLIHAGNFGLLKAIKKFDLKRGRDFITYVKYYSKSYIEKEFYAQLPYSKVQSKKMMRERKSINPTVYWDDAVSTNENGETQTYEDIIGKCDDYETDEVENQKEWVLRKLSDNPRAFHPMAKKVITLRLIGTKTNRSPLSLSRVAAVLSISKERVRQIEKGIYASIDPGMSK